jgi:UDP-N-acetylglucosamine acyltransferase
MDVDIAGLIRQLPSQYPFVLVDRVLEHDPAGRLVAVKNVSGAEEFFEGHFPGTAVMPGVLLMESLAQAAGIFLLKSVPDPSRYEVLVVGIDEAKFRRPAVPGDQLRLEVRVERRRGGHVRVRGEITSAGQRVAEANLLLQMAAIKSPEVDPTARVAPEARLGPGVRVGPYAIVGPEVSLGSGTVVEGHAVLGGWTEVGRNNHFFPFSSVGLEPQDLKYRGERTRLIMGDRNVVREFVTVHVGTEGGGGLTSLGSDNLLMASAHVAHDCRVGSHTVFANGATLAGHVEVQDWATIGAFCGVHQFCRVGAHAFVGGFTVVTRDVLPFSRTVGNRAPRVYGVNTIGLTRRGFPPERIAGIRRAFRLLLQSHLSISEAVRRLAETEETGADARELAVFIQSAKRGVILRPARRAPAHEAG